MRRTAQNTLQAPLHGAKGFPPELAGAFGQFWHAYPKRVPNPRAVAATAFAKAVKAGATPEQLITAAAAYAAEVQRQGVANDFIVHARTFLHQARWQDYLAAPEAAPPAPAEPTHPLWPVLRDHVSAANFTAWFAKVDVMERLPGRLTLRAPSSFVAARLREEFIPLLRRALGGDEPFQIILQLPEAT